MKNPSVTIVVTSKNDERTIKNCVDSLLNQTYKNKKIYITIATSSTDKTYDILKTYGKKIILEHIQGNRPESYNKMLQKVKTEFVAFTDGDAVVDKNWLKSLISSFKPGVVAVGGTIKNPSSSNMLQDLVGRELEYRFAHLPKQVARLPTMNLCVRVKYAKAERFNTELRVAQETEWGYKLNKYGKTIFNSKAVVWHYHRATWKQYFKQQFLYGQNVPKVYLTRRNVHRIKGDEISDPLMPLQIGLLGLWCLFIAAGAVDLTYFKLSGLFISILLVIFAYQTHGLARTILEFLYFLVIFFVRTLAWGLGIFVGLFEVI